MNKYLETGALDEAEINTGHPSTHHRRRNPADAVRHRLQNKGVQRMLDAVIDYLRRPDIPRSKAPMTTATKSSVKPTTARSSPPGVR